MTGADAENAAEAFLRARGLRCIARNYRCRQGEIDLVMSDGDTLVFVEVRLRTSSTHGGAAASITAAKQRRIVTAARTYLTRLNQLPPCRFDAVVIDGDGKPRWLQDVFGE